MAHGSVMKKGPGATSVSCGKNNTESAKTTNGTVGSRRIFAPHFKLQVLDSYRHDADCKGNQRATARKYGIHRRQIQKWLQVEHNLRNSVSQSCKTVAINRECNNNYGDCRKKYEDCEMALRIGRLQDASTISGSGVKQTEESGSVPAPSSQLEVKTSSAVSPHVPLDFTNNRLHSSSSSPIVAIATSNAPIATELSYSSSSFISPLYTNSDTPMDLSLKKIVAFGASSCCPTSPISYAPVMPDTATPQSLPTSQPDVWDLSTKNTKRKLEDDVVTNLNQVKTVKLFKPYLDDFNKESSSSSSCSNSSFDETPCCSNYQNSDFHSNNNNCESEIRAEYTIHELQPKINYQPSIQSAYQSLYRLSDYEQIHHLSGPNNNNYDEIYNPNNLRQRQSYSLDFKLSAIDCYRDDNLCKGNQRAVALKYNVHRRQVQKWLKQEEELRQKNEFVKHSQIVR